MDRGKNTGTLCPFKRDFNIDPIALHANNAAKSRWCPPPRSQNLSADSEWLPTMDNNKNILYLKDVITGHRCKGNSDHKLSWMVGRVSYSFHDCLLTRAPWNHDFHDPRLSPAVLKARYSNAILRVPGPPPCVSARPAPAAAAGTRLTAAQAPPEAKVREGGAYLCRHSVAPPIEESLYPPRKSAAWKLTLRVNGKGLKYLNSNKISK